MKKIACAQMGGPATCNYMVTGETPEEMVQNGMKHVEQVHPDQAKDIKAMTGEETSKWMDDFRKKFDALPAM